MKQSQMKRLRTNDLIFFIEFRNLIIYFQQYMIKIPLINHQPDIIYQFLEKNIGKLYMLIKQDYAIVKFRQRRHHDLALSQYSSILLVGLPLKLTQYQQQQQRPVSEMINSMDIQPQQPANSSNFIKMISESISIEDQNNSAEVIIKKHRKNIIQYVSAYDLFFKSIDQAKKNMKSRNKMQEEHKINDKIEKFVDQKLQKIAFYLKGELKKFNKSIKHFDKQRPLQIDIDKMIEISNSPLLIKNMNYSIFKANVYYLNTDKNSIRCIRPLNDDQFVTSSNKQLKFYNIDDQTEFTHVNVKEGVRGLLVLDRYVLAGNNQGYITFIHKQNLNFQELSRKMHVKNISEIVQVSRRTFGYNIATLGNDKSDKIQDSIVKIWSVKQQDLGNNLQTLSFQQTSVISHPKEIINMDIIKQTHKIVLATQRSILLHDLANSQMVAQIPLKSSLNRVKNINESLLCAATKEYISLVDLRVDTRTVANFPFKKQIKTICPVNDYSIFYGSNEGEVGVLDIRAQIKEKIVWFDRVAHKSKVNDIAKMSDFIISGDSSGEIASWSGSIVKNSI